MAFQLSDYTERNLPAAESALGEALLLVDGVVGKWTRAKQFGDVQTYTTHDTNGLFWAARISEHASEDLSFAQLRAALYVSHTEHEAEYIPMIDSFEELPASADGRYVSRRVHYKFPFPLSARVFDIWLAQSETQTQFVLLSLPRARDAATGHCASTRGRYVSIEVVTQLPNGNVRWAMATTSDAGGWLPQFVQRPEMTRAIARDVDEVRKWIATGGLDR